MELIFIGTTLSTDDDFVYMSSIVDKYNMSSSVDKYHVSTFIDSARLCSPTHGRRSPFARTSTDCPASTSAETPGCRTPRQLRDPSLRDRSSIYP